MWLAKKNQGSISLFFWFFTQFHWHIVLLCLTLAFVRLTSALQIFHTSLMHEANSVHACCLAEQCPNPSTFNYKKDATFCIMCEREKRMRPGQELPTNGTQPTMPFGDSSDRPVIPPRFRPREATAAAPPRAATPQEPPAPKMKGASSQKGDVNCS